MGNLVAIVKKVLIDPGYLQNYVPKPKIKQGYSQFFSYLNLIGV